MNNMHRLFHTLFLALSGLLAGGLTELTAQTRSVIYLIDETDIKAQVTEISAKKIKYTTDGNQIRSYDTEEVMMLFNEAGMYLAAPVGQLPEAAINQFMKATPKPQVDLLVTMDGQVIPAFIAVNSETDVVYQEARQQNGERTMSKDQLAVLILTSGQHQLLVSPSQAAEILAAAREQIAAIRRQAFGRRVGDQKTEPSAPAGNAAPSKEVIAGTKPPPAGPANLPAKEAAPAASPARAAIPAAETVPQPPAEVAPPSKNNPVAAAGSTTQPAASGTAQISREEFEGLKQKALAKVKDFTSYLKVITDANTDQEQINTTIDLACALFANEDARIEVSNANTGQKNKYKVRDYLQRLSYRTSQYSGIDVQYANINYAKDFKKQADGNYYGEIEFMQTFKGFVDGKLVYGDMTRRKAVVIQKLYEKAEEGGSRQLWDVFLSDIGVAETRKF